MPGEYSPDDAIGKISISDHILCACVSNSAKVFPGVVSMDKDSAEKALDILSRDITAFDGVRITRKEGHPILDVYIIVEYGTQIPKLAWELQKRIRNDYTRISDEEIEEINIHIEGVNIKEKFNE